MIISGLIHRSKSVNFAYLQGKWKLLLATGSESWTSPTESEVSEGSPAGQRYDMVAEPVEQNNLYETNPEIVKAMLDQVTSDVEGGRSTQASPRKTTEDIISWKEKK